MGMAVRSTVPAGVQGADRAKRRSKEVTAFVVQVPQHVLNSVLGEGATEEKGENARMVRINRQHSRLTSTGLTEQRLLGIGPCQFIAQPLLQACKNSHVNSKSSHYRASCMQNNFLVYLKMAAGPDPSA
jgi:hypothetical protein